MKNNTTPHRPPVYLGAALTTGSDRATLDDTLNDAASASSHRTRASPSSSRTSAPAGHDDTASLSQAASLPDPPALGRFGTRLSFKPGTKRRAKSESLSSPDLEKLRGRLPLDQDPLQRTGSTATQCGRCASPNFPTSALSLTQTKSQDPGAIYIDWEPNDPENPFNWPKGQRWLLVSVTFFFTTCTAFNATGYPVVAGPATEALHTTTLIYLLGNALHLIAVAITPMILAPASEVFGRKPIFLVATFLFMILFIPQALAPNITAMLVSRCLQGTFASVGNSMSAGLASDIFGASERGFVLGLFALGVFVAQGLAPTLATYTALHHSWRVVFWWLGAIGLLGFSCMALFMRETRGPVLLSRRAKRLTEETGKLHRCRADDERLSFVIMMRISLVRPFQYLILEPIVTSFSLWIGFLWALIFLAVEAVPIVFGQYGWSEGPQSLVLLFLTCGGFLGWCFNFHQERLYARQARKAGGKPAPEARLYYACVGAVFVPVALFVFAWTGRPQVHPVVPIIALLVFATALFPIYVAVFNYLGDVYERYASSALAAQSFLRNVLGGCFPLFSAAMYRQLTPPIASTVLASLATALGVVPFILLRYGGKIRTYSKAAMTLQREEREAQEFLQREREKVQMREERRRKRAEEKESEVGGLAAEMGNGSVAVLEREVGEEKRLASPARDLERADDVGVPDRVDGGCCDCTEPRGLPSISIS